MTGTSSRQLLEPIHYSSATALARAVRDKALSSQEVVRAFLERVETVNPGINAIVCLAREEAMASAEKADAALARGEPIGPLHGVPITLKDSIDTAGLISTAGTLGRAEFVPRTDSTVAKRLRAAGAILLGKTNTPELTLSNDTNNLVYGRTFNPYDCTRTPGGSSGGAAAALASGATALDIGSDTAGSIRFPAHCCGITGIKPTSGRVPRTGHIIPFGGIIDAFTQLGPMARFVDDLILTLPLITGPDWRDPAVIPMSLGDPDRVVLKNLRISFHTDNGIEKPKQETVDIVQRAASALENVCALVDEARPRAIDQTDEIHNGLFCADGGSHMRKQLKLAGTRTLSETWIEKLKPISMTRYADLQDRWDSFRIDMLSFMADFDVIVSPVNTLPALPPGEFWGGDRMFSYTRTYNLTGWPSVVVRGGTSKDGLPIGVQIISRPWREDVALAVAKYLETELVGFQAPSEEALTKCRADRNQGAVEKTGIRSLSNKLRGLGIALRGAKRR